MTHLRQINSADQTADGKYIQCAALCYRVSKKGKVKILMITSQGVGRWILPKGWPMAGMTHAQAAAVEAWEEAGVQGDLNGRSIGSYQSEKWRANGPALSCRTYVFALAVKSMSDEYPEAGQRAREWMTPEQAAELVLEDGLAELLRAFRRPKG